MCYFCVTCGEKLNAGNQTGSVCARCRRKQHYGHVVVIEVSYCFRCGRSYHPSNNSIQHKDSRNCALKSVRVGVRKEK